MPSQGNAPRKSFGMISLAVEDDRQVLDIECLNFGNSRSLQHSKTFRVKSLESDLSANCGVSRWRDILMEFRGPDRAESGGDVESRHRRPL